ncbi:DUF7684 family protein [Noviherbaspirillum denitrificans]|uniref:DUF7684 domain-containing protein n=1 Tax=Noviherbaspirillum denitrificans TaxID=1968433 RepID=A0A254TGN9_9BURK|nr:hypothetical protein [Noviherbaspirillum denitrificans]OWW20462.1 hypothetical protein AYR66_14170 [Noviherbaspirillum denitrificans]
MQEKPVKYLYLQPDAALPELAGLQRFKLILIVESEVSQMWMWEASRWLVLSGCRYMLAWGKECGAWQEAVDEANLERFDYGEIPEEDVVMTTSHEDDDLEEVFWFAKNRAKHPAQDLAETLMVHIGETDKRTEFEDLYKST